MKLNLYLLIIRICSILFPVAKKKVLFLSYYGNQYGCNPKYLSEYLVAQKQLGLDIVWGFTRPEKYDVIGIRKVRYMSLRYFYELCTCRILVTNYRMTSLFIKRKGQFYIQTWHSSLRLKQIEMDAEKTLPEQYVKMAKADSLMIDLLISGCAYSTAIFRNAFWYKGEILESGTPRNDLFFSSHDELRTKIFQSLHLPLTMKLALYAPTFRKNNTLEYYDVDYEELRHGLSNKFGGCWKILVRLHPHLCQYSEQLLKKNTNVIDVTKYNDIQELLFVSDFLITDYSSLMFDFSYSNKPCFLYVPDLEEYIQKDRSLYFDITKLPFPKCSDNGTLISSIENFDSEIYQKNLSSFLSTIGSFEKGYSSEMIKHRIIDIIKK